MRKEIIFGIVSIAVLIIILIKNSISVEDVNSQPHIYNLSDVMESKTEEPKKDIAIKPSVAELQHYPTAQATTNKSVNKLTKDTVTLNKAEESSTFTSNLMKTEATPFYLSKASDDSSMNHSHKEEIKTIQPISTSRSDVPVFKIQLLVSSQLLPTNSPLFKGLAPIEYYKVNNIYKYTYGSESDYEKIKIVKKEKVDLKFKDAFIVAFEGGNKINLSKAISHMNP